MCRLKKHAYAELLPSEKHASQGKNVRTNTRNSAFPRALGTGPLDYGATGPVPTPSHAYEDCLGVR